MPEKEYIERETLKILFAGACAECRDSCAEFDGIEADCNQCLLNGVIKDAKSIPAADVVPRKAYTELQAENCKLKNQVWSLKKKIKEMKSDASWDEDIRRGQAQGMW